MQVRSLGWEESPGVGSGNPLQYSCLGNSVCRGAWRATVHEPAESDMTEQLNTNTDINPSQLYSSPGAAIKNYELSFLKQQKFLLLPFWSP